MINDVPSGKLSHNHKKIHYFSWENSPFQWPFFNSYATKYQRLVLGGPVLSPPTLGVVHFGTSPGPLFGQDAAPKEAQSLPLYFHSSVLKWSSHEKQHVWYTIINSVSVLYIYIIYDVYIYIYIYILHICLPHRSFSFISSRSRHLSHEQNIPGETWDQTNQKFEKKHGQNYDLMGRSWGDSR